MQLSGRTGRRALTATAAAAALVAGFAVAADPSGAAAPASGAKLAPRTHFVMQPDGSSGAVTKGAGIPNIDSVKSTIRTYYHASSQGIADKDTSPYIDEMHDITTKALADLPTVDPSQHKAVVFDADDTLLWTYDMEDGAMHFNFDPALQNTWVQDERFPATPSMVAFEKAVQDKGYAVFGITGRTANQEEATLGNLDRLGYTGFDADDFYTKWNSTDPVPAYVDCTADGDASGCSTVEYKAFTRKHIEDSGYDIVLNVGDQFSDLQGGFADKALKLPNPTYYLPSPDIAGAPQSDSELTPRTRFTMAPDGSSGLTESGEGIPNIDSVKSTIRTYYKATSGIADKSSSPYIKEMRALTKRWTPRVRNACAAAARKHQHPAVVFDADDTTLWTYDMEDGAMHFNFDPSLQNTWVQEERFPMTPGMRKVVRATRAAGCKVVGLTGRNNAQRVATLDNLAKYYYDKDDEPLFRSQYYFTKWTGTDTPPAYVDCGLDGDAGCSTIDYKASTRRYLEQQRGLHIVANFGDQFSDLIGGFSDRSVKLPNPTYYLP